MRKNNKRYILKANRILKILMLILTIWTVCQYAFLTNVYAAEVSVQEKIIDEQAEIDDIKKIEKQLKNLSSNEIREIMPEFDPQAIIKEAAKGKMSLNLPSILNGILKYLFKEIYMNINILIKLVVIVVFCAVLKNLQTSFLSESVGELAFFACYIAMVSILLISYNTAITFGKEIIDAMVSFMHATVPVLITLMVSSGNISSGGILQPVMIMIVETSATIIKNIFIPLIFLSAILSIIDNVSDKVQISKLSGFIKQLTGWSLGIILTIFIAVVSLQGAMGAVVDGVTGKTAKFAINTFIPVVGKYLSDAADAVIGCTLLIKNAAGLAVMIGIIIICLVPILKILTLVILYRLTCVLIEPISEKRIINCINEMANSLTYVLGIVAAVAFMFLISITAMISASNISAMIR